MSATQLPPRSVADVLVERYFADVNDLLCVLSYSDFLSWYHHSYPEKHLELSQQVILYTVFAFGCKDDINGPADIYFSYALHAVGPIMEQGNLETVQALVLLVCILTYPLIRRVYILCMNLPESVHGLMPVPRYESRKA
jgi:hypothetical protein